MKEDKRKREEGKAGFVIEEREGGWKKLMKKEGVKVKNGRKG